MKKFLLSLTAFVATLTASAEWTASFEPVNDAAELKGIHTTTAADGSVYVSSAYNQSFSFAGKDVTDPEGLTSACIVKYSATGEELWAVSMEGAAIVYALDTDTDGTLYVAGNFTDMVKYTGTDGVSAEMTCNETIYSAFVAKISANGVFEAVKVIAPAADSDIEGSFLYYPETGDIHVTPQKIQVDGDNIYVAAFFGGDVAELSWEGSYVNVFDFMYMDNKSVGIFSLSKNDLSEAQSIVTVQNTESVSYDQFYPEAFSFVVENSIVYAGFIGFGNLTLTTANGAEKFTFANTEEGQEHSFVLATIGETTTTNTFSAKHNKMYVPYNLFMESNGDNLIIGGTYYGELYFNTEITTENLNSDIFVASVKKSGNTTNWSYTSESESKAICMTIAENVFVAATTGTYTVDLTTGEAIAAEQVISAANGGTIVYTDDTKVCISSNGTPAGIENAITTAQDGISCNLAGQVVDGNYKGFVIVNGKKYLVK